MISTQPIDIGEFERFARARGLNPASCEGQNGGAHEPEGGPSTATQRFLCNDTGNALRFQDKHGDDVRYLHDEECWLIWNGRRWERDTTGEIHRRASDVANVIWAEAAQETDGDKADRLRKHACSSGNASRLINLLKVAENLAGIAVSSSDFDRDNWLLGCPNGTLDLRTGKLRPARREDHITKQTAAPFDSAATCPRWDRFLSEVFDNDPDLPEFIQRWFGYCLTGDVSEQVFLFSYGTGANGKSVLLKTAAGVLGDYALRSPSSLFVASPRGEDPKAASPDVARLQGVRFTYASEPEEGAKFAEGRIKDLTGSEPVTARRLFSGFITFAPTMKLAFAGNHKPSVTGNDHGIWRRVLLIPFLRRFQGADLDPALDAVLANEAPGILAWMVRGCLEWQRARLGVPASVLAATASYREDEDVLGLFLAEKTEVTSKADDEIPKATLYRDYKTWAEDSGYKPSSIQKFGKRLRERGIEEGHCDGTRAWRGIKFPVKKADF